MKLFCAVLLLVARQSPQAQSVGETPWVTFDARRTFPGQQTNYLAYIRANWQEARDEVKKLGHVLDYAVHVVPSDALAPGGWDVMLVTVFRDSAAAANAEAIFRPILASREMVRIDGKGPRELALGLWLSTTKLVEPRSAPPKDSVAQPAPCSAPEYRAFDFWIGDWDVSRPDGRTVGRNRIGKSFGGCVLHEQYTTNNGYAGSSYNTFDTGRRRWHQTWVDNSGLLLQLDGGLQNGRMVLEGETIDSGGQRVRQRITWTPIATDTVRQKWESSVADSAWRVVFDGIYVRRRSNVRR